MLHGFVRILPTNEALDIKNGILWIDGALIFRCVTDETLSVVGECYI